VGVIENQVGGVILVPSVHAQSSQGARSRGRPATEGAVVRETWRPTAKGAVARELARAPTGKRLFASAESLVAGRESGTLSLFLCSFCAMISSSISSHVRLFRSGTVAASSTKSVTYFSSVGVACILIERSCCCMGR
jgi:hypothetical protein